MPLCGLTPELLSRLREHWTSSQGVTTEPKMIGEIQHEGTGRNVESCRPGTEKMKRKELLASWKTQPLLAKNQKQHSAP